ncbi:MAG: DNA translocase FtsK [Firmicutes bacterium]|nr:DNA translocase FtsK [Bacillota bacterium]
MAAKHSTKKPQTNQKKKASPAKKSNGNVRHASAKQKRDASPAKRQQIALLLFVIAVFLVFLILIRGESIWKFLHDAVLGLFGHSSILWPILLAYVAITMSLEKSLSSIASKIWISAVLICLVTASFYVFKSTGEPVGFWNELGRLYVEGAESRGSGLISGLIGVPMIAAFGLLGAKIVVLLLVFTFVMLLTGTGLVQLFRAISKPAAAVAKSAAEHMEQRAEEPLRRSSNIDIPLDGDPPTVGRKRSTEPLTVDLEHNSKFHRLKKIMSGEDEEETAAETPQEQEDWSFYETAETLEELTGEPEPEKPFSDAPESDASDAEPEAIPAAEPTTESPQQPQNVPAAGKKQEKAEPFSVPSAPETPVGYRFPPVSLLEEDNAQTTRADSLAQLQANGDLLINTLKSFGVEARILNICRGPTVTRYELQPAPGVKISRITNLADDIALNLAAAGVRIEAPIPNKAAIGIEVPNKQISTVHLRGLIDSSVFQQAKSRLTVALGKDIGGNITLADLAKMPHLLIAGSTGSGKSVCINTMITSLLYKAKPDEVRFLMVDPKVVELGVYNGIPHLLVPVVTDPRKAAGALNWAVGEMLDRYKKFAASGVRDLPSYNRLVEERKALQPDCGVSPLPQIVIIVDELADLMMAAPNEVEDAICRLAQMARAAGMHLVIATQRPSVDVITGVIKANIPSRIAFAVSSQVDSRTILDSGGAEKLLGRGDMLFAPIGASKPTRVQGCFVSDEEIERIVEYIKNSGSCEYDEKVAEEIERRAVADKSAENAEDKAQEPADDPMFDEAVKCISEAGQASTSLLQRRLHLGYARAGRLIDQMEQHGIVGPYEGSKPRQLLMSYAQWMARKNNQNAAASDEESGEQE